MAVSRRFAPKNRAFRRRNGCEDWIFDILKTVQVPVRSLTAEAVAAQRPEEVRQVLEQALCFCWRVGIALALGGHSDR